MLAVRMAPNTVQRNSGVFQSRLSGINSLQVIDHVLVKQTVMASSVLSSYRGNKEFIIKSSSGENVGSKFHF